MDTETLAACPSKNFGAFLNIQTYVRRVLVALPIWPLLLLGACQVGPDYQRPQLTVPDTFGAIEGWVMANPAEVAVTERWWKQYQDPQLNELMQRLEDANQDLAAAQAQYLQAQAALSGARAAFYPTVGLSAGVTRAGQGGGSGTITTDDGFSVSGANASNISKNYDLELGVSWEVDLWGKLRRGLESSKAKFQASAADLAALKLSLQSQLVQSYVQLRVLDQEMSLLTATVTAYERALKLTQHKYRAGTVAQSDVSQAQTQLYATQAQMLDVQKQRAQLEHAIAVLVGVPPSALHIAQQKNLPVLPPIPALIPSQLLERRPDVASAERQLMAANADIGVAKAAWYPDLSLSASGGYAGPSYADWVSLPNRVWAIGPKLASTLLDGGARAAQVDQAEAVYQQTLAQYRKTVLNGFREVEDYLIALRVLSEERAAQERALAAARRTLQILETQYRAGMVDYTSVVTVQADALNNERTALNLLEQQLINSVELIAALGGGWSDAEFSGEEQPNTQNLESSSSAK